MVTETRQSDSLLWSLEHVSMNQAASVRLESVDLEIRHGTTAVMGYSGAGKTSLLNLLVNYESPDRDL